MDGFVPPSHEVVVLKQELQALLKEKGLLKARIARLKDPTFLTTSHSSPTAKPVKTLVMELEQAEHYNAGRLSDIAMILNSDMAATITELEQEAIILYEEYQRSCQLRKAAEAELAEATRGWNAALRKYSREVSQRNDETIRALEREVRIQQDKTNRANDGLRRRRAALRSDGSVDSVKRQLSEKIEALKAQIQGENEAIGRFDRDIEAKTGRLEAVQAKCGRL
jgi:hypothetical protein